MKPYNLLTSVFVILGTICTLHADNGSWKTATGGDWNTDTNWTGTTHPDATDAIAGFVGFPTSLGTITSTSNITIGSLVFNTTTAVNINLGNNLTFDNSFANASIIDAGPTSNTIATGTPLILNTNLDLYITGTKNLVLRSDISGSGALSLFGTQDSGVTLSGNNSYAGETFINSGVLKLIGSDNVIHIPNDILVSPLGLVQHAHDNHYSPTLFMVVNGGAIDLAGTTQTFSRLFLLNGGFFFDNLNTGTLNLLNPIVALIIGANSQLMAPLINLINGGGILYDNNVTGTAFIPGPTVIDLQGNSVDIEVPHNPNNCVDVDVGDTTFQNGTLNKTGNGDLKFEGGTVPTFNIEDGTVVIGDQSPAEQVTATGVVTVLPGGTLAGFQTLDAQAGLVNSGTIAPGDPCTGCATVGTLTIHGAYSQTSTGVLSIKGLNTSSADKLIVDTGAVTLDGELVFNATTGATINPGDRFVIIENPNTSPPISGTFSSLIANLPPCLLAHVIYRPHRVIVEITECPCPPAPTPPDPPSNFVGVIKRCKFLDKKECSLRATWTASPSNNVIAYRIYKDGVVVKTIPATSPLVFTVSCLQHCSINGYAIAAVSSDDLESAHIPLRRASE